MNIDEKIMSAHFVQKEAPALSEKWMWSGGADIDDGYVLGLRFKPAPVFHFLGAGLCLKANMYESLGICLKRKKSVSRFLNRTVMGVMFGE